MLKVLIADDEFLIRVGIKSCIDWENNGFEVIGLAEDGVMAFDMVKALKPDIILTDIKMPNMDGLELIDRVKSAYPHIKIIVLSCYNELDYVKKAIKSGAEDYILKLSMENEALLDVLIKTRESIINERETESGTGSGKEQTAISKDMLKEVLFKKYLSGAIRFEEFRRGLKNIGIDIKYQTSAIISCAIDDFADASAKSKAGDRNILKLSVINILEAIIKEHYRGEVAEIDSGRYIIYLEFNKALSVTAIKKEVSEFWLKANTSLKKFLNITISFGAVEKMKNEEDIIKEKYMQACEALEHRFYYGKEALIFYREISRFSEKDVFIDLEQENLLICYLENMDKDGMKTVIDKFIAYIHSSGVFTPFKVKMAIVEILHSIMKAAKRFGFDTGIIVEDCGKEPAEAIMSSETIIDIKNRLNEFIDTIIDHMAFNKINETRPEITRIKSYILEHMDENITLDKAAQISNLSKCYLSTVFKKETGVNLTDYVNRVKMQKAKELLQFSDIKTYEAAKRVGISDEAYFSKLFKKYIGVSPSRVKSSNQNI